MNNAGRIHVLDKKIANKIAAGEVVERPASVIKELVENSIDAKSTSISVEITDGGLAQIRVVDNGIGIEVEDVETAFLRHATSKISNEDDLFNIATLGFRGEALASIAAVSHVTLKTRTRNSDFGTQVLVSGGIIEEVLPCGCPDGTVMEVSDLFYNIPARLKFMKSPRSEAGIITDYISRMILAHPEIAFKYTSSGRSIYRSSGDGSLESAIYTVYGNEVVSHLKPVEYSDGYVKISGFIGTETISRPNRAAQSFFVNGRYIRSQALQNALSDAYETRIMGGRFPFAVLNVDIEFSEVDVNVHPNKLEVRFKNEPLLADALTSAVKRALGGYYVPLIEEDDTITVTYSHEPDPIETVDEVGAPAMTVKPSYPVREETDFEPPKHDDRTESAVITEPEFIPHDSILKTPSVDNSPPQEQDIQTEIPLFSAPKEEKPVPHAVQMEFTEKPYRFLCSIFDAYWFIQQGETIFVIDQHAAHERFFYERLTRHELKADSQLLLVPETVTLTAQEYDVYEENRDIFSEFGFEIEPFGPLTLRVTAVPHVLGKAEKADFLREALTHLSNTSGISLTDVKRDALITVSCKSAIKAGNIVPEEMIENILSEYARGETPLTCPHGRPIMVAITKNNILKMFKRIV